MCSLLHNSPCEIRCEMMCNVCNCLDNYDHCFVKCKCNKLFWIHSSKYLWCDHAKSVWGWSNSVFIFLTNSMHHFHSYILQKIPLKLTNWFQIYEQLKDAKNNMKQKTFSALFGSILKSIFLTSDWFCLITSHIQDGGKTSTTSIYLRKRSFLDGILILMILTLLLHIS